MATLAAPSRVLPVQRLWKRELAEYPSGARRTWYLAVVVITTVVLYYQNYIGGAVATQILGDYHVSFLYFAGIIAVSNAVGALGSLGSGIADRVGRGNITVVGLIACSLVTLFWIPNTTTGVSYGIALSVAGLFEGVILVATPALVRDFSPQVGRAQAMAFWTMGPVLGSLLVTEVSSHTLSHLTAWQDQYTIAGIAGLVVSVLALLSLRELNSEHRGRIVGALEAETQEKLALRGLSAEEATRKPYRQMFKPDIIAPSIAIGLFLLFYYTAVVFLPVYFQTVQGFTASQANSLLNWLWGATALSMVGFGVLSDRLRVRKPFMLVAGLMTVAVDIAFLAKTGDAAPSFSSIAVLLVFSGIWSGAAYVPWMAAFTETVEQRNPALTATGLAVWGWIIRCIVAGAILIVPQIVSSATPLVNDAPVVQAKLAQFEKDYPQLAAEAQAHPEVFTTLAKYSNPATIPQPVLNKAILTVGSDVLNTVNTDPKAKAELTYFSTPKAVKVAGAKKDTGDQWRIWFWVCTFGAIAFCPLSFLMAGHWRPRPQRDAHAVEHALASANQELDAHPADAHPGAAYPADPYPADATTRSFPAGAVAERTAPVAYPSAPQ